MKVLVTGATGFLGSELVHQLLKSGYQVRIYRRETSKLDLLNPIENEVEHAVGDITDIDALKQSMKNTQVVFHVAANVQTGSKSLTKVNVHGTAAVVDAARKSGIERLVHTSSIAPIGQTPGGVSDESTEWPDGASMWPYAKSKHLAELEVHRSIAEGLDAVMVNPSLILGPDTSHGKVPHVSHEFMQKIQSGKIWLYPKGGTNVVDVADVAAGHLAALEHGKTGERYILGSENLSWQDILTILAIAFGVKPPKFRLPYGMALIGGTLTDIWTSMTGQELAFGRSTVEYVFTTRSYSNLRAINDLGCAFRPFTETAQRIADFR
ncbi:MAG: SDR family oxidoreductase [Bacteroidetes bacterium]|nr:SDR family oxidoreductase [Bacteroidota bacterium]MCY4233995.1 SDR family oxidoreductase [Bacteroidota bacterium]